MAVKLVDGLDRPVRHSKAAVKRALKNTDIVSDIEEVIRISYFISEDGDEIDVYDGRQIYDPQEIFDPDEVDEAIDRFLVLVGELDY